MLVITLKHLKSVGPKMAQLRSAWGIEGASWSLRHQEIREASPSERYAWIWIQLCWRKRSETTLPSRTDATGCIPKMLIHVNHLCWAKWQRHCTVLRHLVAMRDVEVITGSVKLFTSDAQVRLWIIPNDMFGLFRVWIFPVLPRRSCTFIALSKFQTLQIGLHGFLIWTPTTSTCESSGAQPAPSNMQIRIERWTCLIQTILSTFLHHVCVDACRWPVAVADSAEGLWRLWRGQRN